MSGTDAITANAPPYPSRRYAYFSVGLLTLAYIFAFVDRMALSLVVDPIREDLGLTDTQVGALVGLAFVVCYVVFSFPFGRWVDRNARPPALTLGIGIWSMAMVGCGLAANFWQLFVGRMLVGVGEASVNPVAYSAIPDSFPPHRRGLAMAIFASGSTIGGGLGVYLGSLLLDWATRAQPSLPLVGSLAPWQVLFIGLGMPGLLVALLIHATLRDPPRRKAGALPARSSDAATYFRTHRRLFVTIFLGFSGFAISNYAFTVWGPTYFMRVHHLSIAQVGILMGAGFGILGTSGALVGGIWTDRMQKAGYRAAPVRAGLYIAALQCPFFLGAYLCPQPALAIALFCCGMFTASMIGGVQGAMVQALTPNRMRGQAGAIYLTVVNVLGLGLAPIATAAMTDYVFGGPAQIGKSLAATSAIALGGASLLLALGLKQARLRAEAVLDT
ncbi:spinster family MFS transporter [Hephaestia sp. GCM10023244]|uniref:spinster family MFS transporter n=1 Tax=unclassified Hephaestia TaxID=2631281 RepID=UPI0020772019|nr:MFS transporter [Hephaestia sp. MAHUQ-44]MCM8731619.1 MFS transporter [Hephaestia sp. MAHUQ-44]